MIYLGYSDDEKRAVIAEYTAANGIEKTVVISADDFPLPIDGTDQVKYSDVIRYVVFYRLLQEIHPGTLIVINECLRTQNRYDLSYNCIRNYQNLTRHSLVFQQLPLIDTPEDFMILFDFATQSRWKRRGFDPLLIDGEVQVSARPLEIEFDPVRVLTSEQTRKKYAAEREKLFKNPGNDPHAIPRNLALIGGLDKRAHIDALADDSALYVARNKRLGRQNVIAYGEAQPGARYTAVELPHRFIDYCDFVYRTGQEYCPVLTTDLKVDAWYVQRYQEWSRRLHETYASL